jgi:signal peptidase I
VGHDGWDRQGGLALVGIEKARESQEGDGHDMGVKTGETQEIQKREEIRKSDNPRDKWEQKEIVARFVIKLAVVLLVVGGIFTFVFGIRQVSGEAMYPRLRDGDLAFYFRLEGDYQIGDVVTFRKNGVTCWGRIVARGGDVVDLSEAGQLLVNGNIQQEEIFYATEPQDGNMTYPYTVKEDSYFILCDFRTTGIDSRTYGAISKNNLDGKVITILRRRGI